MEQVNIRLTESDRPDHTRVLGQSDAEVMSLPEVSSLIAVYHLIGRPRCPYHFLASKTKAESKILEIFHRQVVAHSAALLDLLRQVCFLLGN